MKQEPGYVKACGILWQSVLARLWSQFEMGKTESGRNTIAWPLYGEREQHFETSLFGSMWTLYPVTEEEGCQELGWISWYQATD